MDGIFNLKYLKILAIAANYPSKGHVSQLMNTSVIYLSINSVDIIERGAFSSWKTLKTLELKYVTNLGIHSKFLFRTLSGLHAERLYVDSGLSGEIHFRDFEAPNLNALAICNTQVNVLDFNSFSVPTLEWLDISHNRLDSFEISFLHQLYYLDISDQTLDKKCLTLSSELGMKYFPDSLTFIDLSGTPLCYSPITCVFQAKLVNLRNTGLRILTGREVLCQRSHEVAISHLDLQENHLQCVNSTFFAKYDWSALNILKLSSNRLASDDNDICGNNQSTHHMDFLKLLWNLTDFYLDRNFVENDLPSDMLLNQTKLQSLHLSHMALTNLTLKIHHLKNLNFLDLSDNKIRCLYSSRLWDINTIIGYTPGRRNPSRTFEINLSHNDLRCSCSCLEFYQWMKNVRHYVTFTDLKSYQCTFDNGQKKVLSDFNSIANILHSECVSTDWSSLIRTTTIVIIVYMFIRLATASFRFRHSLRYIWLKHRMHREYLERQILDPNYSLDAFISSGRSGPIRVKRNFLPKLENQQTGLKFCIAQRDFIVGATIIDNIVRCINKSRKVVYVISQNFLNSGWCKEELLIGHHESLSRDKNILICIFMPDIIQNQLSDRFRFILNHVTCIKWPLDTDAQQVFWIMLERALLDGKESTTQV